MFISNAGGNMRNFIIKILEKIAYDVLIMLANKLKGK